jgi:hypothetical protein
LAVRLAIPLVLACLLLVACGDSGDDGYKEEFPPLSRQIVELGEQVGAGIESAGESTDKALADDFDGYAQELGDIEQKLDDLEPPDDLAEAQDELVSAIGDVQNSLEQIAAAARESDAPAARQATMDLIESSEALRDARRTLADEVGQL